MRRRLTALLLSWIFTATTVWGAAPLPLALPGPEARAEAALPQESSPPDQPAPACNAFFFGPKKYVRTSGPKTEYSEHFSVPAWITAPFVMKLVNGEPNGQYRVSSAEIEVNEARVVGPSDLNQNVASLERVVALTSDTELEVELTSAPGSYLTLSFCGQGKDTTPPQVVVAEPPNGSFTSDRTPRIVVRYPDPAGAGEPGASGPDLDTLKVTLDGVDRTALLTKRPEDASGDLPDALALSEGTHRIKAEIRDRAGNLGQGQSDFQVDTTPPSIHVTEPPKGSLVRGSVPVRVAYEDAGGLDPATLHILVNGVDRTDRFAVGPAEATAILDPSSGLKPGANQIEARIEDRAKNQGFDAAPFTADFEAPRLVIAQPTAGSRVGARVDFVVHYSDDQGLDLGSFRATLDGNPLSLAVGPDEARGQLEVPDGSHAFAASIKDRAGNPSAPAAAPFTVDGTRPNLRVEQPSPGSKLNDPTPLVIVKYDDEQGIDLASLKIRVNGVDRTTAFAIYAESAQWQIPEAERLSDGTNRVDAEVKDQAENAATASSSFTVDTVPPQATIESPGAITNAPAPQLGATWSDDRTGIDTSSARIFVDGVDRTALFAVGQDGATGPVPALVPGDHTIAVKVSDGAGNQTDASRSFLVDRRPPVVHFREPAAFTNDSTPTLRLELSDPAEGTETVSGIDAASLHVYHRRADEPETEITALFAVQAGEAVATIPQPLADGTHHLRATLSDKAGNPADPAFASFELDTVKPTYTVEAPANAAVVGTAQPTFLIKYQDDRGPVDMAQFRFALNGVDLTSRLQAGVSQATGTLPPADALAGGDYAVSVVVVDRAGNAANPVPHHFWVDTAPPQVSIEAPGQGAFLPTAQPLARAKYSDAGPLGVDLGSVRVFVDGVNRTADFAVGADAAQGTPLVGEGHHVVRAEARDFSQGPPNPPGFAESDFTVDTQPPLLTIESPADGSYVRTSPLEVRGQVEDADPETTVACTVGGVTVPGTRSAPGPHSTFTCLVPLTEGPNPNEIELTAKDRLEHSAAPATIHVTLDTHAPTVTIVEPAPDTPTSADKVKARVRVEDTSPIVSVVVNDVGASLEPDGLYTAMDVPVTTGMIEAVAKDAAGNAGTGTTQVRVDRDPPLVKITSPAAGAWVKGPQVDVRGTVKDATPTLVEVNGQPELEPSQALDREFRALVGAGDGALELSAIGHDSAGNTSAPDTRTVNVDSTAPVIELETPSDNFVTRETQVHVSGRVVDASPAKLDVNGSATPLAANGSFSVDVPVAEGPVTIDLQATDAVELQGHRTRSGFSDRIAPTVDVTSPAAHAVVPLPVVVQGTVDDLPQDAPGPLRVTVDAQEAVVTGHAWTATFDSLPEGEHVFQVLAKDGAGNTSAPLGHPVTVSLQQQGLQVVIEIPANGTITREPMTRVEGSVLGSGVITVNVSANGHAVDVAASGGRFVVPAFPLAEEDNTIVARASNTTGQQSDPHQVTVTLDTLAPDVQLQVPATIGIGKTANGQASAVDRDPETKLQVRIDGAPVGPPAKPPVLFPLEAPPGAKSGDTLPVEAVATDRAGNTRTVVKTVAIVAEGVVVGQVLSDRTGLPLQGAAVVFEGTGPAKTATTDAQGQYTFNTKDAVGRMRASGQGLTTVDREISVQPGVGTLVVDSRLTPLADPKPVGPDGYEFAKLDLPPPGAVKLKLHVPAGAVTQPTDMRLTALSAQGLPGLSPLGWSPLAAFDVRATAPVTGALQATVEGLPAGTLHLVRFDATARAWVMAQPGLVVPEGTSAGQGGPLVVALPGVGSWSLVVPDADPAPGLPGAGVVLPGLSAVELPTTATSEGVVEPSVVPPTGGQPATGRLSVASPVPLPSGTVVQADVKEEYELASGQTASEEPRRQDVLLFQAPSAGAGTEGTSTVRAEFPIAPSRTFELTELVEGTVSLAILAGRESVRGTLGGNQALTLEAGGIILTVPASSLAQDTAVSIDKPTELSPFLATGTGFEPVSEAVLDFAGASLTTSAGLSIEGTVEAGETWLVVRVDRVLGIPRLLVVALAEASGGRISALAIPGLPGIREDGRYVFYRVTEPLGWVSGPTTLAATGQGVSAVVESDRLPFIARSFPGVPYLLATGVGAAHVTASAPGSPLSAVASVDVPANTATTPLLVPLALEGAVTTATITPADESEGVSPTAPIELLATAPLLSDAANFAKVVLRKGTEPVEVRYLLSGSGRRLAIIPAKPLDVSTIYTVAVDDLKDAYGGSVVVSSSTFRTKDLVAPTIDTDAIVFSYPQGGMTKITAPQHTLPPFAQVVIINATTGEVGSFQVDGDGGLGLVLLAAMQASIDDLFMVTITDTNGNVYTFQRSKFVKDDGTVVIGPGGGTVTGPGGVELRLPSGALEKGVELSIAGVTPEQLAQEFPGQVPDLGQDEQGHPLAHVGGGLQITSNDKPAFKKEIDLVFPLPDFTKVPEAQRPPAGKPEDAYYYVVRRVEGPADAEGHPQVLFQTIDHAFLECPPGKTTCEAGEKKLVTASYPFSGYLDSYAAFGISPAGAFALQPVVAATAFLMWTYDSLLPGKALAGVVTGKVLRTRWDPLATVPTYEPVEGAVVTAVQMTNDSPPRQVGQRLFSGNSPMATTRADGTFTLWDPRYVGGTVQVAATLVGGDVTTLCPAPANPKVVCGTAFESDPADWKTTGLQFHRNIATVNLTFPAEEPPPPAPAIEIKVFRIKNGQREDTLGISSLTEPLILGLRPSAGIDLREVQVQGAIESFRVDPLKGQPNGMDWIVEYAPGAVGTYRVEATGLRADSGGLPEAIKGGTTFRVIGEGGRDEIVEGQRPEVIPARTSPKTGQKGVSVTTYVQVVFTEPVKKISGNVSLKDPSGNPVPVKLSGVLRGGGVIDDLDQAPDAAVTSLTVQPLTGLQYGVVYTLSLGDGIQDLDATPNALVPYETNFTTFTPESLSDGVESFGSPGIVVLGERAYLVHNFFSYGTLRVFETTDPVTPLEIPNGPGDSRDPRFGVAYRPVDIVGEAESPLTGGRVVAVATGPAAQSKPSNIWLLDVNNDSATRWIGAVSLTATAAEGFINRTFMRAGVLYAATQRKGIQVVDLGQVMDNFKPLETNAAAHFQMRSAFLTDGQGYGQENVVSIQVPSPFGGPARLADLKAGLVQTAEGGLLVVAAAADHGLVVANPGTQSVLSSDKVTVERVVDGQTVVEATLRYGQAIGMGNVAGQDVTVIVGSGTVLGQTNAQPMLMVVSLFKPENPKGLGYLLLEDATVGDILFKDDLVLLGGSKMVTVVSLTNPAQPRKIGTITGVGGRLALSEVGILFSTERSVFGGSDLPLGGVRTAALGNLALIDGTYPPVIVVGKGPAAAEAFKLKYRVIPSGYQIDSQKIQLRVDQATLSELPIPSLVNGRGELPFPAGYVFPKVAQSVARPRLVLNDGTATELISGPRTWKTETPVVELVWPHRDLPPELAGDDEIQDVSADQPLFGVRVFSREWLRRADLATPETPAEWRTVDFAASSAPAQVRNQTVLVQDGVFETELNVGTVGGAERWVEAKAKGVVLGSTDPTTTLPGRAFEGQMTLTLDKPAIPADGASVVTLTLTARDRFGNLVADRTPVVWEKPAYGEFVTKDELTLGGVATATYRSTSRIPPATIKASIGDQTAIAVVQQLPVTVSIETAGPLGPGDTSLDVVIRANSSAGPVDDKAELRAMATSGVLRITQPLSNGEAHAVWFRESAPVTKTGILMNAGIAGWTINKVVPWVGGSALAAGPQRFAAAQPGGPPVATIEPAVIAGDRTEDGMAQFRHPDGEVEEVPVKATATYRITDLVPGEHITVRLGSPENPNRLPVAMYRAESGMIGTLVTDDAGDHDGQASGGVATDESGYRGRAFSFDGTGVITVPHEQAFEFTGGFMVQTAVRPPPGSAGGLLIEKAGQFHLGLVREGSNLKASFSLLAADGEHSVTSTAILAEGTWTLVTARYESGQLSLRVGSSEDHAFSSAPPVSSPQPMKIGSGFSGGLDEVRVFDLSRAPMALLANGEEEISFTADSSGVFETEIRSNGQLAASASIAAAGRLALPSLAAEGEPESIVDPGRAYLGETVTHFQDRFYESRSWYGMATTAVLAAFFKFIKAMLVGAGSDADIFSWVGEIIRTIWMFPVAVFTDVLDSGSRIIQSSENPWDAAILGMAVLQIAAIVLGRRIQKLRQLGALLKATSKEGEATALVARLAAKEAAIEAAGVLGRVRRAEKIAQIAFVGGLAAQHLVPLLRDIVTEDEDIDRLEAVVAKAEQVAQQPGDRDAVLAELAQDEDVMVPSVNRTLLRVAGTPVPASVPEDEDGESPFGSTQIAATSSREVGAFRVVAGGTAVSAASGAVDELMDITPTVTRGMKKALKDAFKLGTTTEEQFKAMKAVFRVVKRLNRKDASEAFKVYEGLQRLGVEGVSKRYLSELTHPSWGKMHGALLQGRAMLGLAERAKAAKIVLTKVSLEVRRVLSQVLGAPVNRLDGEIEFATRRVGCETKNWGKKWSRFPPSGANKQLTKYYNTFKDQFLKRAAELGPNLTSDYYMEIGANFCGGGSNRARCIQEVRAEMARLLKDESGELKRLMKAVGLPDSSALAQRYQRTRELVGKIADIFEDPWAR